MHNNNDDEQQQPQQGQGERFDSLSSSAFDDDYGDDPDDFVANTKPSGGNKRASTNGKNKQGSIYSSKHTRIKQAQREKQTATKKNTTTSPKK